MIILFFKLLLNLSLLYDYTKNEIYIIRLHCYHLRFQPLREIFHAFLAKQYLLLLSLIARIKSQIFTLLFLSTPSFYHRFSSVLLSYLSEFSSYLTTVNVLMLPNFSISPFNDWTHQPLYLFHSSASCTKINKVKG